MRASVDFSFSPLPALFDPSSWQFDFYGFASLRKIKEVGVIHLSHTINGYTGVLILD
jgi:hypothetical protein